MKLVNKTGYLKGAKTAKNPVNIIPSSLITTQGMAFPIKANGKTLYPNTGQYKFPTSHVVETPLKQKFQKGTLSISAKNKKQFADVANMKPKAPEKKGTLRQEMKKSFSTLNKPITFGQKPGSVGDKVGSVLNLGSSRPGQGYSITPTTTAKQTAFDVATGEVIGAAAKPVVKYVSPYLKQAGKYLKDKISPTKVISKQTTASKNNFNLKNLFGSKDSKIQSGTDWMKDWYSDSDFSRRYSPTGQQPAIKMQTEILNRLNQYQPKNYIDLYKDKGLKKYLNASLNSGGISYGNPKSIYVNRTMSPFNKKGLESTRAHELTHLIERNGGTLSTADEQALLKPFEISNINEIPKNPGGFKEALGDMPEYYLDPTEIHARMNQTRYELGLSPKDKFTEEMFDKVSKKNNWDGMGRYIKDKKGFTNLMNNFWAAPPAAVVGAGAMQEKKNGAKTLKYKNGSKGVSLAFSRGEKDPKGGLTQKGVDKYNRATGGNLKMAVTTPPSKLKAGSKDANRRKSFCSRMKGMKSKLTSAKTANDPNSRINKSLRKWNCN